MSADLFENAVDQLHRPVSEAALPGAWFRPDGEELRSQIAPPRRFEIQMSGAECVSEIPRFVDKTLRRVGVGVDDER